MIVQLLTHALAFILGTLTTAVVLALLSGGPDTPPRDETRQRAACGFCGDPFPTRQKAREHLREVHNAPGTEQEVDALVADPSDTE